MLEWLVTVEPLGEGKDRVRVVIAAVVVENNLFLFLVTLGSSSAMRPEEIGHASNGIIVVEKIDTTVTITISTIIFNIGRQKLWNADGAFAGANYCKRIYVILLDVVYQSRQFPVTSVSPLCEPLRYNSR